MNCDEEASPALGPMLGHCAHLSKERMNVRLEQYDVTPVQTHMLLCLVKNDGQLPQRMLADSMHIRPPTVNGILDRLEEKGLVERRIGKADARRNVVMITEKGREQCRLFSRQFQAVEHVILRGFSTEEVAQLRDMLERIMRNLEEDRTI